MKRFFPFLFINILFSQEIDTIWIKGYASSGGLEGRELGGSVALDNYGNVYTAGIGFKNRVLIKYGSDGYLKWIKSEPDIYSASWISAELPKGLTFRNGKLYYTTMMTHAQNPNFEHQIYTFCYDTMGNRIWGQVFGHYLYSDYPAGLMMDAQGNVYVAGTGTFDTTTSDVVLLKYNGINGNLIFAKRYWSNYAYVLDVAVDCKISFDSNYIYIFCLSSVPNNYQEYRVLKYSTSGSLFWVIVHPSSLDEVGTHKIFPDFSGNIYCLFNDTLFAKYNSSGNLIFEINLPNSYDANDLFVDENNNLYVAGRFLNSNNNYDAFLRKYSPQGNLLWEKIYDLGMNEVNLIIKAKNGYLLILCESEPGKFFLKYSYNGDLISTSKFFLSEYIIRDIAISSDGHSAYSAGTVPNEEGIGWPSDMVTVKYYIP